jgi:hypothetical protein
MKVVSFLPFGLQSKEAGLVSLLSSYLGLYNLDVKQLLCNGIISACNRDKAQDWQRGFSTCLQCISEQSKFAAWSGRSVQNLSSFLHPKDIDQTKRWILGLERDTLIEAEFEGLPLAALCQSSLRQQFEEVDLLNRSIEAGVRRVLLSAARVARVFRSYALVDKPDYVLIAGGDDFLSSVSRLVLKERKIAVSLFSWNSMGNDIVVENPTTAKVASYPLVFDDVTSLRADIRSWPPELLRVVEELMAFIDLAPAQVAMPF